MKKKRQTKKEVIKQLFDELTESGDLILIATDEDLCECGEFVNDCNCSYSYDDDDDYENFLSRDIQNIYRSVKNPDLCFYDKVAGMDGFDESTDILLKFDHKDLNSYLDVDIKYCPEEYDQKARKIKIDKLLELMVD